ncbi:MAG: T9SS type A sorting domain-containing protein [Bacteroidales bacterium]|nr:T9SS type A sorting domain-containing protein [Bacteroidales bacterium]
MNIFPALLEQSTISFYLAEKEQVKLEICDISGKVLQNIYDGELIPGEHEISLNLTTLSNGLYLGHLSTQGESICKSFIINNQ